MPNGCGLADCPVHFKFLRSMPKLWRYICLQTLGLIAAITALLICALILLRPDEITRLAAVSGSWRQMGIFFFVTLPYLLPIALPLATMAGCAVTASQMIQRGEWLALATAGFSPWQICAPIMSLLFVIGACNALICSELVQTAHIVTERLKLDWAALRPLRALQPRDPLRLARIAVAAGGRKGESLDQFLLCYARPNPGNKLPSLELLFAKGLDFKSDSFEMIHHHLIHLGKDPLEGESCDFFVQTAERSNISIPMVRSLLSPQNQSHIPMNRRNLRNLYQLRREDQNVEVDAELIRRAATALLPIALGLLGLLTGALGSLAHRKRSLAIALLFSLVTFLSPHIGKLFAAHLPSALIAYFTLPIAAIAIGLRCLNQLRLG